MKVEYRLTEDDIVHFMSSNPTHLLKGGATARASQIKGIITLLIMLPLVTVFLVAGHGWQTGSIYSGLVAACTLFFLFYGRKWLLRQRIRNWKKRGTHKTFFEDQSIELTPEGLITTSRTGKSVLLWPGVHQVVRRENYLYVFLNPTTAYLIPARAFPDELAFANFADTAKRYHEEAGADAEEN